MDRTPVYGLCKAVCLAVVTDSYRPCRRGGGGMACFGRGHTLFADVSNDAAKYADGSTGFDEDLNRLRKSSTSAMAQ
jgi:hypothetical protein